MSLQNMNQMQLVPKKDYVANRLVSGALQLAKNTSLFLDETQLQQGQLDTTGECCRNHEGATLRTQTPPFFPVSASGRDCKHNPGWMLLCCVSCCRSA